MSHSDPQQEPSPFNAVPPAILALVGLIIGIELVFWAGARGLAGGASGVGWRLAAFTDYGFPPRLWAFMFETGQWSLDGVQRLLTYAFLNDGFLGAIFSSVFILAFGKFVGDVLGGARALLIFLGSAIGAAAFYGSVFPDQTILVGSFPGAYGLLGGYTYILFVALESADANKLQAFRLIGILAGIQLLFGALFGGPPVWVADLVGAALGFAIAALLGPGGLVRRIRRR